MPTAADIGDFLHRRLALDARGTLLYDNKASLAFGLVTGFLPTDLCMLLLFHSRYNDDAVRNFLFWLHMHSAKSLWRPTFNATKETHPSASTPLSPPRTRPISLAPTDPSIEIPDDTGYASDDYLDSPNSETT